MSEIVVAFCKAMAQVFSVFSWGTNHLQEKKKQKLTQRAETETTPFPQFGSYTQSKDLKNPPEKEKLTNSLDHKKNILH